MTPLFTRYTIGSQEAERADRLTPRRVVCVSIPFDSKIRLLKEELRSLMGSYQYAFAMGHGCTIGNHPEFERTRHRVASLRAQLAEFT